jgi:hypothetical protein
MVADWVLGVFVKVVEEVVTVRVRGAGFVGRFVYHDVSRHARQYSRIIERD